MFTTSNQKLKFCINTNLRYSAHTLHHIIPSLLKSNVNKDDILVVEGGCSNYILTTNNFNIKHVKTTNNSFDLTCLIEIVENQHNDTDYWFLIHDTCKVGEKFSTLVNNIPYNCNRIALHIHPSMYMGAYKYDFLVKNKKKLFEFKNKSNDSQILKKLKQVCVCCEDIFLWRSPELCDMNTLDYTLPDIKTCPVYGRQKLKIIENSQWLINNSNRIVEYYPQLDLYKSKANYTFHTDCTKYTITV